MKTTIIRNQTADTLKGLAVIFMIQVHIMEQFSSISANNSMLGKIAYFFGGPFCAPVFIAVMGYFLASSNQNFLLTLKRGIHLFFLGILLNIGRSIHLFIAIFQGKFDYDLYHFVFGADILTLAGLSIILLAFLQLISKKSLFLYFPILILFVASANFLMDTNQTEGILLAFIIGNIDHSYFPLFPWFSYVLAGYIFRIFYEKYQVYLKSFSYLHWIFIGSLSAIILFFTPYAFNLSFDLAAYYHHGFNFFIWVIGFMLIYILIINYLTKLFCNSIIVDFLSWCGKNVTVIYIIQWVIIGNIATAIYRTQNLLYSELWFVGIVLISCLFTIIFLKMEKYFKNKNESLL